MPGTTKDRQCPKDRMGVVHRAHPWTDPPGGLMWWCQGYGEPGEGHAEPAPPCPMWTQRHPHAAHEWDGGEGRCPGYGEPPGFDVEVDGEPHQPESVLTCPSSSVYSITAADPTITIQGDAGKPLVSIHPNGTLEYGEGYDPDDAAQRFWDALRTHMPTRCTNCGHVPGNPS